MVLNVLNPSIDARYIRVHPKTWRGHISMRMELLGCPLGTIIFFHFLFNKQTGFHLIDKSARLSPRILIQLQFGLILIPLNNQRAKYAINLIANTVMCFTLSYLQTTGASKIKRELLTNQGHSQLFDMLQACSLQVASKETG